MSPPVPPATGSPNIDTKSEKLLTSVGVKAGPLFDLPIMQAPIAGSSAGI